MKTCSNITFQEIINHFSFKSKLKEKIECRIIRLIDINFLNKRKLVAFVQLIQ